MSSMDTGSSATITSGPRMMARAITARCFWPPERSEGYLVMNRSTGDNPTCSSASSHALVKLLALGDAVDHQRVADRLLDRHRRVEGSVRVLEDHLQVGPELAELGPAHVGDDALAALGMVVGDRAARGVHEPEEGPTQGGLAGAGLPHDAQHLAAGDGQGDAVDGLHAPPLEAEQAGERAALELEVDGEVVDLEHGRGALLGEAARSQASSATLISSRFKGARSDSPSSRPSARSVAQHAAR